jgi:hypothetical protein
MSRAQKAPDDAGLDMQGKQDRLARAMRQTNDTTFLEQVPLIAVAKRRSQLRLD